jgi:hypothetical protein
MEKIRGIGRRTNGILWMVTTRTKSKKELKIASPREVRKASA